MNRSILRWISLFALLATTLLLLPAPAQEGAPPAATPATTPAEESDTPPDLGEDVSADNSVSFPVDI